MSPMVDLWQGIHGDFSIRAKVRMRLLQNFAPFEVENFACSMQVSKLRMKSCPWYELSLVPEPRGFESKAPHPVASLPHEGSRVMAQLHYMQ